MAIPRPINENSSSTVGVSLKDAAGVPAAPVVVSYRIDCLTTGEVIVPPTTINAPGASFTIAIQGVWNRIVGADNPQEYRRLTLTANYATGDELTGKFDWIVNNLKFIQ